MTTLLVVRNADGYVVAYGPADGSYQPAIPAGCTFSVEIDPTLNFVPPPEPTPIEQIRALEAPLEDDFKKIQRQFLIASLLKEACALPQAAGLTKDQVHELLMSQPDKAYAKLVALESLIIPLRELIP